MEALKYVFVNMSKLLHEGCHVAEAALEFTKKEEIVNFISENAIKILNLCHIPEDGRLKTLSFTATKSEKVYEILDLGERVDGSSLFSSLEPGASDIYILPRLDRAFVDPFSQLPTLNVLCDYLDSDGKPLQVAPQNVLARAENRLCSSNDVFLKALAELEFYVICEEEHEPLFPGWPDRNYHESSPFAKSEDLRNEIMLTLSNIGIATKYGHSEVGRTSRNGEALEQQEIELSAQSLVKIAESVAIAKWAIRNVGAKRNVSVSFSPKIAAEHAGNGMHIHVCALRKGKNIVADPDGTLSSSAKMMIGGILKFASSLSAFANPTPVSYLRLITRKESPMHICWSSRNRLALIRIPLWRNPRKAGRQLDQCGETFEYRAPDAFANPYLLLAGLATAIDYGLSNPEEALRIAEDLHVDVRGRKRQLKTLPLSCSESADNLARDRQLYEADQVFPENLIDKTIELLKSHKDRKLWQKLTNKPDEVERLLRQYRHFG